MCDDHQHALHEVTGAEEAIAELRASVEALQAQFEAESAVSHAVASGSKTIPAIVAALRRRGDALMSEPDIAAALISAGQLKRADVDRCTWLGRELHALANQIEQEAGNK